MNVLCNNFPDIRSSRSHLSSAIKLETIMLCHLSGFIIRGVESHISSGSGNETCRDEISLLLRSLLVISVWLRLITCPKSVLNQHLCPGQVVRREPRFRGARGGAGDGSAGHAEQPDVLPRAARPARPAARAHRQHMQRYIMLQQHHAAATLSWRRLFYAATSVSYRYENATFIRWLVSATSLLRHNLLVLR